MNYTILISLLLSSTIYADQVKKKTFACPSIDILKKAPLAESADPMDLSMYAIANGCEILSTRDKVEAVGYDPRNSKDIFQEIIYKRTGTKLYVLRSSITVEQGGKKNRMRF